MSGHLPPTGSVWAIQDTANKTVSFGRGLLEAATSDDINPIALGCCAAFGAVIPVATETRVKIEQLARRNHTSHVFNFIKAVIGYKKDDSVEQLSRSDSGIRFLCLCATLCTFDLYDAADRLDAMLQLFRNGDQLRPTVKQLQVMLLSLKNKMEVSDFASSIVGYEILVRSKLIPLGSDFTFEIAQIPAKGSLQDLLQAIHNITRPVSPADRPESCDVTLHAHHVPWTCAFIKWMLGIPPTIKTSTGVVVLDQPQAPVVLFVIQNGTNPYTRKRQFDTMDQDLSVAIKHNPKSLRELVFYETGEEKRRTWQGLVSPRTWLRYHFSVLHTRFPELETDEKLMFAVRQALGYIVKYLPEHLVLCGDINNLKSTMKHYNILPDDLTHRNCGTPFLEVDTRWTLANKLTSGIFKLLDDEVDDAQVLMPHNLSARISGSCKLCTRKHFRFGGHLPCRVHELLEIVGTIGAVLLVLTLFGQNTEAYPMLMAGLKFNSSRSHDRLWWKTHPVVFARLSFETLVISGWQSLMYRKSSLLSCPHNAIFKFAAEMTGNGKIADAALICAKSSQVLFPAFLEAQEFAPNGYMQLCCLPGKLLVGNMEFQFLIDRSISEDEGKYTADNYADFSDSSLDIDDDVTSVDFGESENDGSDDPPSEESQNGDEGDELPESQNESQPDASIIGGPPSDEQNTPQERETQSTVCTSTMPRDFVPATSSSKSSTAKLQWEIFVREDVLVGELQLIKSGVDRTFHQLEKSTIIPWLLVEKFPYSRFTPQCSHARRRVAGALADHFELHAGPTDSCSEEKPRALFNTDHCYALQVHGLNLQSYWPPTIIHHEGCIRCALQICLDASSRLIVS